MQIGDTEVFKQYFNNSRGYVDSEPIGISPVQKDPPQEVNIDDIDYYTSMDNIDDIDRFVEALRMLLQKAWGDDCPTIVDEYPTNLSEATKVNMPIIVYDYYDRRYADNVKRAPQLMGTVSQGDETYELYSQWFDCTLEFNICHNTARAAKVLMKRFEVFMQTYMQYFKYLGISNITFQKEPKSTPLSIANQDYAKRVLRYDVRLERRYIRRQGEAIGTLRIVFNIDGGNGSASGIPGITTEINGGLGNT